MTIKLSKQHARKVLEIVDCGLTKGMGVPEPGKLCVEAAVCLALGIPHSDNPPCVGKAVRQFKVVLNDSDWSSNEARAKGLRRLAIAQLGSNEIDQKKFAIALSCLIIRRIVPAALRAAATVHPDKEHQEKLEATAKVCESDGTADAARAAREAAARAAEAAYAAREARAARAADAAAYAAREAAARAAEAAADAADAADAAEAAYAAREARAARAADAAAYAAAYAADAADAAEAAYAARDELLTIAAECAVEALEQCGSPGCKWLDLCEAAHA